MSTACAKLTLVLALALKPSLCPRLTGALLRSWVEIWRELPPANRTLQLGPRTPLWKLLPGSTTALSKGKPGASVGVTALAPTPADDPSSSSTVAVHNTRPADVAAHVPPDDVAAATSSRRDGLAALAALSKQADALLSAKAQETKAAKRDTARQEQLTRQQIAQPLCPLGSPPSPAPSRGA